MQHAARIRNGAEAKSRRKEPHRMASAPFRGPSWHRQAIHGFTQKPRKSKKLPPSSWPRLISPWRGTAALRSGALCACSKGCNLPGCKETASRLLPGHGPRHAVAAIGAVIVRCHGIALDLHKHPGPCHDSQDQGTHAKHDQDMGKSWSRVRDMSIIVSRNRLTVPLKSC